MDDKYILLIDRRITIKLIWQKWGGMVSTELNCSSIGSSGRLLWTQQWTWWLLNQLKD
jgi:hypothetical protein